MHLFSRREIRNITDDLELFVSAVNGATSKRDELNTKAISGGGNEEVPIEYTTQHVNIIPEIENAVIGQVEKAGAKNISLQLHLSPASFVVSIDRDYFQQIFFRLLTDLLNMQKHQSVISIYVTDSDGKCVIELMSRAETQAAQVSEDYFKKYRITNARHVAVAEDQNILIVYKKMIEDMGGELSYVLAQDKPGYVRIKFALV